jgi:hypothetical protein
MARKVCSFPAKGETGLGYQPSPVDGALRRAVEWFQANGYAVPPSRGNWRAVRFFAAICSGWNGRCVGQSAQFGDRDVALVAMEPVGSRCEHGGGR